MAACSLYRAGRVCHYSIQHWHFLAITVLCYCVHSIKLPSKNLPRMVDLATDKSTGTKHDIQEKAIKEGCSTTNLKCHTLLLKKVPKTLKTGQIAAVVLVRARFVGVVIKVSVVCFYFFFARNYFILARPPLDHGKAAIRHARVPIRCRPLPVYLTNDHYLMS